jgi:hypothetical protein
MLRLVLAASLAAVLAPAAALAQNVNGFCNKCFTTGTGALFAGTAQDSLYSGYDPSFNSPSAMTALSMGQVPDTGIPSLLPRLYLQNDGVRPSLSFSQGFHPRRPFSFRLLFPSFSLPSFSLPSRLLLLPSLCSPR